MNAEGEGSGEGTALAASILVVDDEPVNRRLLERYLTGAGYSVRLAEDGKQALRQVSERPPDLMLVDIAMPLLDGLSFCRLMRDNLATRAIPIILVTAKNPHESRIRGFAAGADDFMDKPFELDELKVRIEGALKRRRWSLLIQPLTRLPSSPALEEEVWKRLTLDLPWAFAYIDIDNFKAYNDVYGYERGDRVIKDLGNLLIEASLSSQDERPFPGHIGGDDFALVASPAHMERAVQALAAAFDAQRDRYYSPVDRERGVITTQNRRGKAQDFPLMTLTIAVVSSETREIRHYARLVELASEMKHYVKTLDHHGHSLCLWDRRRDRTPAQEG